MLSTIPKPSLIHFARASFMVSLLRTSSTLSANRGALHPDVTQDTIPQTICVPGYRKEVERRASIALP